MSTEKNESFKEDLLNVCGSFANVNLNCIEHQNDELERLKKENKDLEEKYNKLLTENFKLKQNPILIEFEKWLDEKLKITYRDFGYTYDILQQVMNKLQELKEGKNNGLRKLLKVNDFLDTDDIFIGIKDLGYVGEYAEEERAEILDEINDLLEEAYINNSKIILILCQKSEKKY